MIEFAERMSRLGTESAFEVLARAKALEAQEFSLKGLRCHILNRSEAQQNLPFMEEHPLIRPTAEYEQITHSKGLFQ